MRKNELLFQLIKSLTANEKRFFKIYASRHTIGDENNYVKLFDLLDTVKVYDEFYINSLVEKAYFVKYFAAEKNYLYNFILDCLDIYHKESSVDRQISKLVNIGRVLMDKKLDEQAAEVLEKARKLSIFHNRYENLLPINALLKKKAYDKESIQIEVLSRFRQEETQVVDRLKTKLHYLACFDELLLERRLHGTASDQNPSEKWVIKYPHLDETIPDDFPEFDIAVYYLISRIEYYRIARNKGKGRLVTLCLIAWMENNRAKITGDFIERYSYALYTFVVARYYVEKQEAEEALRKLHDLDQYIDSKVTKQEHAHCFEYYIVALTDIYLETKEYEQVRTIIPDYERAFPIYESHMTPTFILMLHFNIACLFFGLGEYRQALVWVNKVRNVSTPFREDLFDDIRILNMLIHLELGNDDILPSLIKSAHYHSKKHSRNAGIQHAIIEHIKLLPKADSKKQRLKLYSRLRDELLLIRDKPNENSFFMI